MDVAAGTGGGFSITVNEDGVHVAAKRADASRAVASLVRRAADDDDDEDEDEDEEDDDDDGW